MPDRWARWHTARAPERCPSWLKERDWKSRNGGFPRSRVRIPPSPLMLVLSRRDVETVLDPDRLVDAVGRAMADLSAGSASVPNRTAAEVEDAGGVLIAMPAYLPSEGALAAKLVSLFPGNAGLGLPTHHAVVATFDRATGAPTALLDGELITAMRTAACSALSAKLLAREDAAVLAVLGTGVQARAHARALPRVRGIREIRVAGRDPENEAARASGVGTEVQL